MKASLWTMIVEGWLPRAAASRPGGVALETPQGSRLLRGAARRCERGRGRAGRARREARAARRDRSAAGARLRAGAPRLPAARCGRGADRPQADGGRARADHRRRRRARRGAASRRGADRARRRSLRHARGTTWRRTAVVIHTSGTTSATQADRAHLRQLPLERARLGRRARSRSARALAVRAAARPRRRPLDPAALDDLRHDRGAPRALRHRRRPEALREQEITLVSRRRHHARAPARCGPRASAGAALRADRRRAGAARARCPRARGGRAGEPHLRADRGLLAGHDHAGRGAG